MSDQATAAADPIRAMVTAKSDPGGVKTLLDALDAAGVTLGEDDQKVAAWLAGADPQGVAVIASWVERASKGAA